MGNLTTFTIRNDDLDELLENEKKFCEDIREGATSRQTMQINNGLKSHGYRHADEPTIYLHMGNSVFEINVYSKETERLMKVNPVFFKEMIHYMKSQVKDMEIEFKKYSFNPKKK